MDAKCFALNVSFRSWNVEADINYSPEIRVKTFKNLEHTLNKWGSYYWSKLSPVWVKFSENRWEELRWMEPESKWHFFELDEKKSRFGHEFYQEAH